MQIKIKLAILVALFSIRQDFSLAQTSSHKIDSITLNISFGVLNSIYFSVFQRIVVLFFSLFNIDKSIILKHNSIPSTGYL
jgi:hypothetical protein